MLVFPFSPCFGFALTSKLLHPNSCFSSHPFLASIPSLYHVSTISGFHDKARIRCNVILRHILHFLQLTTSNHTCNPTAQLILFFLMLSHTTVSTLFVVFQSWLMTIFTSIAAMNFPRIICVPSPPCK